MDATRTASMVAALDMSALHGGAVAALRARGIDRLGDDLAPDVGAFLARSNSAAAAIAEGIALGYLWRDVEGDPEPVNGAGG